MPSRLRLATALAAAMLTGVFAACEKPPPPVVEGPRPVKLFEIRAAGSGETREYPGRIKAGKYSEMGFEVPGRVIDFVYNEGARVKKGAVLAKVDPRDYQADYDAAVAKLAHARAERDRYKEMYEQDVKPFSEYELRMRRFEVEQAALRQAKKALDDTILRAPFDGVMARKLVEKFENVLAKQAILVMQNDDFLEIKVNVPERDLTAKREATLSLDKLTKLLAPRVVVSSVPDREYPAEIKELASVADPTTRTFEATFRFEKPTDANILGGMTAKVIVNLIVGETTREVLVPASAVIAGEGDEAIVWVVDPDSLTAESRTVRLGSLRGDGFLIEDGLAAGETIAISGVHELRDGMTVRRYDR